MEFAIAAVVAYLLGSIPFALLLAKWLTGVDVRTIGSGNVGATNASRTLQKRWQQIAMFLGVYVLDFAKGFVPTWFGWMHFAPSAYLESVGMGFFAVLGHCTSPFLGFRAGKGVATSTGVFAFLEPFILALALVVFFVVRLWTKQTFLGSLAIGVVLGVGAIVAHPDTAFGERWPVTALALFVCVFLVFTHRRNIRAYFARH